VFKRISVHYVFPLSSRDPWQAAQDPWPSPPMPRLTTPLLLSCDWCWLLTELLIHWYRSRCWNRCLFRAAAGVARDFHNHRHLVMQVSQWHEFTCSRKFIRNDAVRVNSLPCMGRNIRHTYLAWMPFTREFTFYLLHHSYNT